MGIPSFLASFGGEGGGGSHIFNNEEGGMREDLTKGGKKKTHSTVGRRPGICWGGANFVGRGRVLPGEGGRGKKETD